MSELESRTFRAQRGAHFVVIPTGPTVALILDPKEQRLTVEPGGLIRLMFLPGELDIFLSAAEQVEEYLIGHADTSVSQVTLEKK